MRRIQPELISPSHAVASANPAFLSAPTQQVQQTLDLREQAAIAAEKLPPGRRIFIDLSAERDVNWCKVLSPPPPTGEIDDAPLAKGPVHTSVRHTHWRTCTAHSTQATTVFCALQLLKARGVSAKAIRDAAPASGALEVRGASRFKFHAHPWALRRCPNLLGYREIALRPMVALGTQSPGGGAAGDVPPLHLTGGALRTAGAGEAREPECVQQRHRALGEGICGARSCSPPDPTPRRAPSP